MLSKEEIEKAKEKVKPLSIGDFVTWFTTDGIVEMEIATETLLQYIDQLEQENKALKKGQASLMSSRKKWKDRYYKLKAKNKESYWKGYIQKQNEAMEICQMCKYRKQYFEKKVEISK